MQEQPFTGQDIGHRSTTAKAIIKEIIAEADEQHNHTNQDLRCRDSQQVSNAIAEAAKIGLHLEADPDEYR
ncbi:hypothetical protein [Paenibacillus tarimensis]|uniref:hypothetical protein n=1 Tax=Paenibacillus tarimensis TaxID=416012 RepID=UPI001F3B43B0|nr:hypothetical protein [Paenibacillus tarimensis]MCF2946177.1 hypothetical protein [Paenibacillus tarimensis]